MRNPRAVPIAVALTAALIGVVVALRVAPAQTAATPQTSVAVTSFDLPRLDGAGDVRLATYRGHPVVATLFASWCSACREDLPAFAEVSAALRSRVTFIGVDSLDPGDGSAMARQFHIDWWPLARDVGGSAESGYHDSLGVPGMPVTAFYDAGGALKAVKTGVLSAEDLRAELQRLFGVGA